MVPAVHRACNYVRFEKFLKFFVIECHADINEVDQENHQQTALVHACHDGLLLEGVVKCLIDLGANVKAVDIDDGQTALDYVVMQVDRPLDFGFLPTCMGESRHFSTSRSKVRTTN